MAASNEPGIVFAKVGRTPSATRELFRVDSATADNAAGSDPYYINGVEMPPQDGVPLNIGQGPHIGPGELLYLGLDPDAQDGIDTDDALAVVNVPYVEYDVVNGKLRNPRRRVWNAVSQRQTDKQLGGIDDDPTATPGQDTIVYAFGPCPPNTVRTLFGRFQLDIRDDTA